MPTADPAYDFPAADARGQQLLRSVLEAPDDDTPRLVYADYLEEIGNSRRAEFIRVQCALTALGEPRKVYRRVERLSHRRNELHAVLYGPQTRQGERVDFDLLPECQQGYRQKWHGLLVTDTRTIRLRDPGVYETWADLRMDDLSQPWQGVSLLERQREIFQDGTARGSCGLSSRGMQGTWNFDRTDTKICLRIYPPADASNVGWEFVWRRGFVEQVTAPFTGWCGTSCRNCALVRDGSRGFVPSPSALCNFCQGTSRIGPEGPNVVRLHPITQLRVTGPQLAVYPVPPPALYAWIEGPTDYRFLVEGGYLRTFPSYGLVSEKEAHEHMGTAALQWSRRCVAALPA